MTAARGTLSAAQRDLQVAAEMVRAAYGGERTPIPSTVYANLLATCILVWALFGRVSGMLLATWVVAQISYQVVRVVVLHRYWQRQPGVEQAQRWGFYFALQTFANGCLWGSVGIIFFAPNAYELQTLIAVLLCGMAAGSIPVTAMLPWAFWCSAGMIMMPLIVRNILEGGTYHLIFGVMLTVFLMFVLNWGRSLNKLLTEAYARRFENLALVDYADAAKQEAIQANIAKSRFLAAASHDLRQPLHALTLFVGALKEEKDPARTAHLADNIDASLTALNLLLNSLLDISKLDAGVIEPQVDDFHLQSLFDRIGAEFAPLASKKRLRLRVRETKAIVRCDQILLERIVRNLISNAIRYTESGTVLLASRWRRGEWRIEVRDTGIGIPSDQQEKVFGEFYQIGNQERDRQKGLGLGLSIVSRMSSLMACPVDLCSEPGRGSTFSVAVQAGQAVVVPATTRGFSTCENLRVLVIDDEAAVLVAMSDLLGGWQCEVLTADSLLDATNKLTERQWEPDAVFCDYRLRGAENGIEVLDWMRRHFGPDKLYALITGDTAVDRLKMVQECGYLLLHKPVPPSKLRSLLNSIAAMQPV